MLNFHCNLPVCADWQRIALLLAVATTTGCQSTGGNSLFSQTKFGGKTSASQQLAAKGTSPHPAVATPGKGKPASSVQIVQERLRSAEASLAQGDYGQAQQDYETVISYRPDHADANHGLAIIADQQGQYQQAEQYYMTALRYDPNNVDLLANLGYSYLLQKKYTQSEDYLRRALEKDSKHRKASINLGDLYAQVGDSDRALAMYRNVSSDADAQSHLQKVMSGDRSAGPTQLASDDSPKTNKRTQKILEEMEAARLRDAARSRTHQRSDDRADQVASAKTQAQAIKDWELQQRLMAIDEQEAQRASLLARRTPVSPSPSLPPGYDNYDPRQMQSPSMQAPDPYAMQAQYAMQPASNQQPPQPQLGQRLPRPEPMAPYQPQMQYAQQLPPSDHYARPGQEFRHANHQQPSSMHEQPIQQASGYEDRMPYEHQARSANTANPFATPWNVAPPSRASMGMTDQYAPRDSGMAQPRSQTQSRSQSEFSSQLPPAQRTPYPVSERDPSTMRNASPSQNPLQDFEAAQMKAMQMGMNAGPGQMFPLDTDLARTSQPLVQPQSGHQMAHASHDMSQSAPQAAHRSLPGSNSFLGAQAPTNWNRSAPDQFNPSQSPSQHALYSQDRDPAQGAIQQLGGNYPHPNSPQSSPSIDPYQQQMLNHQREYQQSYQQSALAPQTYYQPSSQEITQPNYSSHSMPQGQTSADSQTITWQDHMYRQRGGQSAASIDEQHMPQPPMQAPPYSQPPQQASNAQQSLPQWNPQSASSGSLPQWNSQSQSTPSSQQRTLSSSSATGAGYPPYTQQGIGSQLPVISPHQSGSRY